MKKGIVGTWSTMVLNIMDFTRLVRTQKEQILGQVIGMPASACYFAFLGMCL